MHIVTKMLILFFHSLHEAFRSNYTCFLLLWTYLHEETIRLENTPYIIELLPIFPFATRANQTAANGASIDS